MKPIATRLALLLALGMSISAPTGSAAPPAPCQAIPAEEWGSITGYKATATPGEMNCTYASPDQHSGGQFRIMAVVGSSAEAEAGVKRMRDHQAHQPKGGHDPSLDVIDSQGPIVFSIALFQEKATAGTAAQLQKLAAAAKKNLPK